MNRKRRFRVWDKLGEYMITHDKGYQGHYVIGLDGKFNNLHNGSGGDDVVLMEWTGLNDKNGVEIYEGDIVKHWIDLGPAGETQIVSEIKITEFGPNLEAWAFRDGLLPEVLGNIFENKDLLNQSNEPQPSDRKYNGHTRCSKCGQVHWMHGECPS